jgi:uncharacterized membrane protein
MVVTVIMKMATVSVPSTLGKKDRTPFVLVGFIRLSLTLPPVVTNVSVRCLVMTGVIRGVHVMLTGFAEAVKRVSGCMQSPSQVVRRAAPKL